MGAQQLISAYMRSPWNRLIETVRGFRSFGDSFCRVPDSFRHNFSMIACLEDVIQDTCDTPAIKNNGLRLRALLDWQRHATWGQWNFGELDRVLTVRYSSSTVLVTFWKCSNSAAQRWQVDDYFFNVVCSWTGKPTLRTLAIWFNVLQMDTHEHCIWNKRDIWRLIYRSLFALQHACHRYDKMH